MIQPVSSVLSVDERNAWIAFYYQQGFTYTDICGFLLLTHNTVVTLRQLKRILKRLCLRRRNVSSSLVDCLNCISNLYQRGFGECGYRTIWRMIDISTNLRVTQDTVRRILGIIDAEGVRLRGRHRLRRRQYQNKGPNFCVHVDGYDKLKPYGIAIHGAIDGFSRKILWLEACYSNNDPKIIAGYYLNYVKRIGGVPRLVRADAGTENVLLRDFQTTLRFDDVDPMSGFNSYQTGRSTSNQRIERFWGNLRIGFTVFWRNLFRDMVDSGMLRIDNQVHVEILRFCFMHLIQRDLDSFVELWNLHRIRQQRNVEMPCGIPSVLYHQPELFDTQDYMYPLRCSFQCIEHLQTTYTKPKARIGCRDEFIPVLEDLCDMEVDTLPKPDTVETARELFAALCELTDNL